MAVNTIPDFLPTFGNDHVQTMRIILLSEEPHMLDRETLRAPNPSRKE